MPTRTGTAGFSRRLVTVGVFAAASLALASAWMLGGDKQGGEAVEGGAAESAQWAVDFTNEPSVEIGARFEGEVSRRILALYDSSETVEEEDDDGKITLRPVDSEVALAHRLAELPLNHLGFAVDFHDVNSGELPSSAAMERYHGVLVWFSDQKMRAPLSYLDWLAEQMQSGRKVVVMEFLGGFADLDGNATPAAPIDRVMSLLGGAYLGGFTDDGSLIAMVEADPEMIGFERKLPATLGFYQHYRVEEGSRSYLRLERTDQKDSASDVVWTSANGGFAMPTMAYSEDRLGDRYVLRWLLDPFRFFETAYAVEGWPRVDFTTLNGRRIYYSHIDGDGLEMISELDYKSTCGAVIRDQILKKYDLPVTASVVVGLTGPPPMGYGNQALIDDARSVFALANVEVASHGRAHPMDWRAGAAAVLSVNGLADYSLSGAKEIVEPAAYISRKLAPPGKPCRVMLWTGWCNPNEEQLGVAYSAGLRNLNGGDPRMDAHYPSYAHLVPPVHQVGKHLQFYTSAANDYIQTGDWQPPYYRFQNVIDTFERSGSPRRVIPVNVYYHFYSARNLAALTALQNVHDWVVAHPLAPRFTGEYIDVARDFHWARLARRDQRTWLVRKGRALRTVRFDDPGIHVDIARSSGVIGYLQDSELGATYVHLDDAPEAVVTLSDRAPELIYVQSATHRVDNLRVASGRIELVTGGPGRKSFVFAGVAPGSSWQAVTVVGGEQQPAISADADGDGALAFTLDDGAAGVVDVIIERRVP